MHCTKTEGGGDLCFAAMCKNVVVVVVVVLYFVMNVTAA